MGAGGRATGRFTLKDLETGEKRSRNTHHVLSTVTGSTRVLSCLVFMASTWGGLFMSGWETSSARPRRLPMVRPVARGRSKARLSGPTLVFSSPHQAARFGKLGASGPSASLHRCRCPGPATTQPDLDHCRSDLTPPQAVHSAHRDQDHHFKK